MFIDEDSCLSLVIGDGAGEVMNLSSEKKLSKILIVSFPHKNHLTNLYKVNVSNYIDEVVKVVSDKRLYHLNFSNFDII